MAGCQWQCMLHAQLWPAIYKIQGFADPALEQHGRIAPAEHRINPDVFTMPFELAIRVIVSHMHQPGEHS